jgi:hypothetical protein
MDVPHPQLEAYVMVVPLSAVVVHPVVLTATGRLRAADIRRLNDAPAAAWSFVQRPGHQVPDLPGVTARVARQFGDTLWEGVVTRLIEPEDDELDGELYYHVVYTDTDAEDCTREQLLPLLRAHAQSDFRHRVAE